MLPLDLRREVFSIGHSILEIELSIIILVDADGQDIERARTPQTLRALDINHGILALDVVTIEPVGCQLILSGDNRNRSLQHAFPVFEQNVAAPDMRQRAIAVQMHITHASRRFNLNLHFSHPRGNAFAKLRLFIGEREDQLRLAAILL